MRQVFIEKLSGSQAIPRLLWNPNVHYHIHNNPPLDHILSQLNPVHTLTQCHIPRILFPSVFPPEILYAFLIMHELVMFCPVLYISL
jgi:hypothetical protein